MVGVGEADGGAVADTTRGSPPVSDPGDDTDVVGEAVAEVLRARCTAEVVDGADELVCQGCGNAYPVRDDIPVLLVDEARKPA